MGCSTSFPEPPQPYRRISSGSTTTIEALLPPFPTAAPLRLVVCAGSTVNGTVSAPWLNLELWCASGSTVRLTGNVNNVTIHVLAAGSTIDLKKVEYSALFVEGDITGGSTLSAGNIRKELDGPQLGTGLTPSSSSSFVPSQEPPRYEEYGGHLTVDKKK